MMEAAISSSLAHPNVVATYTYSIKPVRDTTSSKAAVDAGIIVLSGSISNTSFQAGSESESGTPRASGEFALALVHSYEVSGRWTWACRPFKNDTYLGPQSPPHCPADTSDVSHQLLSHIPVFPFLFPFPLPLMLLNNFTPVLVTRFAPCD